MILTGFPLVIETTGLPVRLVILFGALKVLGL